MTQDPKFQKSQAKKQYDAGHIIEFDIEHKKRIDELNGILDQSTDFLTDKDIQNIKRILSKLSKKLLDELKEALINKQMNKFREIEVLHEDDDAT
ncbi:MAG: hypothetical protein Q8P68_02555 [Candidatus Peregrinibacteria bacterium]|nr:hypothetical protein [Candidatus Peregrinibacteria bacterium]